MADVKIVIPAPVSKTVSVSPPAAPVSVPVAVTQGAVSAAKAALAAGNAQVALHSLRQLLNHQDFQTNSEWQALFAQIVAALGPNALLNL
jgi:hypothetical protein